MANETIECPDCGGSGLDWDTNEAEKPNCSRCCGTGKISVETMDGGLSKEELVADEKVECPDCDGDGLIWSKSSAEDYDCPTCEGEGEVDKASL